MPRILAIMKLNDSDNRVAKSMPFDTAAEAEAHIAAFADTFPDAFVHQEPDDVEVCSPKCWQFNPVTKEVTDRSNPKLALRNWDRLRTKRNTKLVDSDWTQYNDSPLTDEVKAEWTVHRQALRDLPENTDDPADPTWPEAPE